MNANFVNVIGYQFERVHTGVIKWLLDTDNTDVHKGAKFRILQKIYRVCGRQIPFQGEDIQSITCKPEYAFGRRRKIDLVVEIELAQKKEKHFLVIEMKVDSIPYKEQLQGTRIDFRAQLGRNDENKIDDDILFLLFLLGSAQVCETPAELHHFHVFRLPEILEVFDGLIIDKYVYRDWIDALKEELGRLTDIGTAIEGSPAFNEPEAEAYWRKKGYRIWQPLYFYIYHALKRHAANPAEWDIYSGLNNPVMNLKGTVDKRINGVCQIGFYWEFNYEEFILKARLDGESRLTPDELDALKKKVAALCESTRSIHDKGQPKNTRYGTHVSLYKWDFDFKNGDFASIMKKVEAIVAYLRPRLEQEAF